MPLFKIHSKNSPSGDQPKAIDYLVNSIKSGNKYQTLLGVTGSGKTFTVANTIARLDRPALVIAHNKTLAAQLCNEFREFFPENSVNYFVSYYDYYQPEAYIPNSDTYIGKEAMINDEIDKLRHAATVSLLTRRDCIIVASVSCIYGLGTPESYAKNIITFQKGAQIDRNELLNKLIFLQYTRTNSDITRGTFRLRGDYWEIMPLDRELVYQIDATNGIINSIYEVDPVEGFDPDKTPLLDSFHIAPAKHFVTEKKDLEKAVKNIEKELEDRIKVLNSENRLLEVERLERRTKFDIAMIREIGYCNGIENYSRQLSFRAPGEAGATLLDYFPKDFITVIDESHVTLPQLQGMYAGDSARKTNLIEYGFRLPSARDNRPLRYEEFESRIHQTIFVSATPSKLEKELSEKSGGIVEQVIRPTGLVDPEIIIRPARTQIKDLITRLEKCIAKGGRALVTTLTKKMAEDLSAFLEDKNMKSVYLHSDIKTLDRVRILNSLRKGEYDILIGVNLLREGLDLPEVTLVAILDADKEGFLRSETSLIQTIGRAARNVDGVVLMYADKMTGSLDRAIKETNRRRVLQLEYNKIHNITPKTIIKSIKDTLLPEEFSDAKSALALELTPLKDKSATALEKIKKTKEKEMRVAAKDLDFELAAILRDEIKILDKEIKDSKENKIKK